jgi:hypothetical protein
MPAIKPTCVRDLKLRVNLADVVSRVVTLRKAGGARLKGLCPFHNEKTPSFNVDTDKGFFKCFGCGKAGDAITFVRETEQLSFTEAIEALGQRFNIPIEYEEGSGGPSREERSLRQEIYDLHEQAAEHFHQAFKAADPTGDFFRKLWSEQRRFPLGLADEFKIENYAPGDRIIRQGDPGDRFYLIRQGKVSVRKGNPEDHVVELAAGDFFGEMALLSGQPRNASVWATEACLLYSLHQDRFGAALAETATMEAEVREAYFDRQ